MCKKWSFLRYSTFRSFHCIWRFHVLSFLDVEPWVCPDKNDSWLCGWDWYHKTTCSLSPPVKMVYWPLHGGASFVDPFCYLCFVFVMCVHCSLVVTCWERANFLALLYVRFLCFFHFPIWCLGSVVVLDCIDSWSVWFLMFAFFLALFVWFDFLRHSQHFSCYVGTVIPGLNQ